MIFKIINNTIITGLVFFLMASCGNQSINTEHKTDTIRNKDTSFSESVKDTSNIETEDTTIDPNLSLYDLKPLFKYTDKDKFNIDEFNITNLYSTLPELSRDYFRLVWQNSRRKYSDNPYLKDLLYSWQNRDTNFIEIIIMEGDIEYSGRHLTYCIYDKNQKIIDRFTLSSSCADGGWWGKSFGQFTNRNIYKKSSVEYLSVSDAYGNEFFEGDTTFYQYSIGTDGKITEKKLNTVHFKKYP